MCGLHPCNMWANITQARNVDDESLPVVVVVVSPSGLPSPRICASVPDSQDSSLPSGCHGIFCAAMNHIAAPLPASSIGIWCEIHSMRRKGRNRSSPVATTTTRHNWRSSSSATTSSSSPSHWGHSSSSAQVGLSVSICPGVVASPVSRRGIDSDAWCLFHWL